jgi:polyisoprenyl-phosphate glycosyltransferase
MPPSPEKLSVSFVTPCYNEEDNVELIWQRIRDVMAGLPEYDYEHIIIDNCSSDATPAILRRLAATDLHLKIIFNARNFGHIRSPVYGLMQATGDAVMLLASDLQDPPELIPQFLAKWRDGFKIVVGVKNESQESPLFFFVRKCYYNLIARLSEVPQVKNFTGFGLYDQQVIVILRQIQDPYPYFRGLICDLGFARAEIPFVQPVRTRGFTKNNFYTLYDIAMLGITNHSKVPLRLASFTGFCLAGLSLLAAVGYLVYKLLFWNQFQLGLAPLVIGLFFFSSVQLIFLGIVGEYVGAIHTQVLKRPLVVEKERINFPPSAP